MSALVCGLWSASGALAQDEGLEAPSEEPPALAEPIEVDAARRPRDAEIAGRLADIFGATKTLGGVEVRVDEGVVTLTGTVPDAEAAELARTLAARARGVVTVDTALERDTSVEGRLAPATARARKLGRDLVALLPVLGVAIGVVVAFGLLGVILKRQGWLWRRLGRNPLVASLLQRVAPLVLVAVGLIVALHLLNAIAVLSAVLGAAGVLGIALGFAVRDTVENFIASVMLSIRQPFRPKDLVEIDGQTGNVVRLTSRATILLTLDGNHLRIPNADVFKATIVNYTRHPRRRLPFELGIDAGDDAAEALRTGARALAALDFVLDDPPPDAWLERVGDSNVVLTFAPWIDQERTDFLKARTAAVVAAKRALERGGFTLPEPTYRLRIDEAPAALTPGAPRPDAPTAAPREAPRPRPGAPPDTAAPDLDTRLDPAIHARIDEDRDAHPEADLLSEGAPTEFGDGPRG